MLTAYRSVPTGPGVGSAVRERLTAREFGVLSQLGRGWSNTEITQRLGISEVTVKSHIGHILGQLGLRDRGVVVHGEPSAR